MKQVRVLVVDDEPHVADALCRALTLRADEGWMAESCPSAETALDRLANTQFDVLVTDLCLPGMSGLGLIHRSQSLQTGSHLHTILITAYGTSEIEEISLDLADAYLPKPFNLDLFVRTVRGVLNQNA